MGTKVQCKSYLPGYYSMRDLNEDSNGCGWSLYYGDKTLTNGQYYNGFWSRVAAEAYPGYDKDAVKRTMLEHEAIFKTQVYELHRLYRTQRDLMDEIKRKELHRNRIPIESSLSSSPLASQITSEDARKWHNYSLPMVNPMCARPSMLGVEGIHSPLSSMKGNCTQTSPFPSQSGCSTKDIEVLESRPTKVRRKMFDLQLPADEYIDTEEGEQLSDDKVSAVSSSYPNKNCQIAPESGVKFFLDDSGKNDCKADALNSDTHLRSRNGLADLNEPVQLEDIKETNSTSYDFCNGKIQDSGRSTKTSLHLPGLPKEISVNSYGSDSGTKTNLHLQKNGNGSAWFPHVLEAGQRNGNLQSVPQSLQTEKLPQSSQPTQVSPNKVHEPLFYLSDKSKVDLWREKTVYGVEISESSDFTNNRQLGSIATSHVPNPYEIPPPDLGKHWSHPWENSNSSISQKSISVQTYAALNSTPTLSKSSQASVQSDGIFGDKWYLNSNARSNQAFGSELPYRNGFCQGSSSGPKELPVHIPSISGDYLSCRNENNKAPGHLTSDGLAKYYKGSNCTDMKSAKDMNLNVVISDCSSNQETPLCSVEILRAEKKHEDHLAVLPWFRAKPACKNETPDFGALSKTGEMSIFQSSHNQSSCKSEIAKDCNQIFAQNIKSSSSATDVQARKTESSDCPSNRKLLGFPIFEKSYICKNESSSLTSQSVSLQKPSESNVVNNWNRVLDINLPCDPTAPDMVQQNEAEILVVEKETDAKFASFRHHIDLNSCLSDDEASLKPSASTTSVKFTEIDLEAPVPEIEDDVLPGEASALKQNEAPVISSKDDVSVPQDELMMVAAEAIVAISSSGCRNHMGESCNLSENPSKESSLTDPLKWFVEIASSCGDDLEVEGKFDTALRVRDGEENEEDSSEGIDYFESMILKLTETTEEDYMPKPLVPEDLKLEETGTSLLSNRPRKGQARRGRQRRDFQRDILPGLASLSRHEVTEDLQTFGGLMRATGHSWHSGLTRRNSTRNGSGRGRRRLVVSPSPPMVTTPSCTPLVQQLNNVEMGLEDRSLTGWGKTTRRPRRQRCPAGNPPSIPLT